MVTDLYICLDAFIQPSMQSATKNDFTSSFLNLMLLFLFLPYCITGSFSTVLNTSGKKRYP